MLSTTDRLRGLYGQCKLGTTPTGSDLMDTGEIRQWELRARVEHEDARALGDFSYIGIPTGDQYNFTFEKLVLASAEAMKTLATNKVVQAGLWEGRHQTATSGTGALLAWGMAILDDMSFRNVRGPAIEGGGGTFSGAINF